MNDDYRQATSDSHNPQPGRVGTAHQNQARRVGTAHQHQTVRERLDAAWSALASVTDPEIPVINIVDLGMVAGVRVENGALAVDLTPTFAGCPALDVIRTDVVSALSAAGEPDAAVKFVFDPPWTSDRITQSGLRKLKEFGLAPPGRRCGPNQMPDLERTPCPYCESTHTRVDTIFGPTLCRSIHYCDSCRQSFEHFKPV